jgi:NADPH-dependent glutamate synthase beta subunit-like oxidoreductase/glutamate synthase domain-containing protein 3/NAD-dependent dihydropyrimidine dehydrogenase PreA subunit
MGQKIRDAYYIPGMENGKRVDSRILEERIQKAVEEGYRKIEVEAYGQHGIGGRLWKARDEEVVVYISGPPGQRVGSMGFPNTRVEVLGNASDDVGWLNAGAEIVVHGHASNGVANAMAQGKIYIAGNIGARGMTMTKFNPRFSPPELWVLGSVGDYFAEFMAGGIAVICGYNPQNPDNVLGYRPCVGMVGGKIFVRGKHGPFSEKDAKRVQISEEEWNWLLENLKIFLQKINREELFEKLNKYEDWDLIVAKSPQEKRSQSLRSMSDFYKNVWCKELGEGGLIGDLVDYDRSPIPVITTGDLRRYVPVWENGKYAAPCESACPTGIPVQERWALVREGRVDEAVDMALFFTPFPTTVCGYLCPNLCMQNCTKQKFDMVPVDITLLGKASADAKVPDIPPITGKKIAIIGGGPAGISAAWQLKMKGHDVVVFDRNKELGGKITEYIPKSRIPDEVLKKDLERIKKVIPHIQLEKNIDRDRFKELLSEYDYVVIAIGAQKPRILPVEGKERLITSLEFLGKSKKDDINPGSRVVIIGAGNVGCDVATEAHRLGATDITLIDIQEPASFGKERKEAEKIGAKFRWPVFTKKITEEGVVTDTGEVIYADTVVISIGDAPELEFLTEDIETDRGFIKVNEYYQTSNPKVFAIGDVVRLGLITDAIGAGRIASQAIDSLAKGEEPKLEKRPEIDKDRMNPFFFNPRLIEYKDINECANECMSCGRCRDCGICITLCPQAAISRVSLPNGGFELIVNDDRCIGCGFCADVCPCGVWKLVPNEPMF